VQYHQGADYCALKSRLSNPSTQVLIIDRCARFTDVGLEEISEFGENLSVLSCAGISNLTNDGMMAIASSCTNLSVLNLSHCYFISDEAIIRIVTSSRKLQALHLSACRITDDGMGRLAPLLDGRGLTSLDLSLCRDISDHGIELLSQACTRLSYLNLCGLNRITHRGIKSVLHRLG
jgi:hypothetical protein